MTDDSELVSLLNHFISDACLLVSLLKKDSEYFRQNNLEQIEKNNDYKQSINLRLAATTDRLQALPSLLGMKGSLYEKLSHYTQSQSLNRGVEVKPLLAQLAEIARDFDQVIAVNRRVLQINQTYVRELLSVLANNRRAEPEETTYNAMGTLEHS